MWLHHLNGRMSLGAYDLLIYPLDRDPEFLHVLYEHLRVKNLTEIKTNIKVLKFSSQKTPQRTKKQKA